MMTTATINNKGQITIPTQARKALGIQPKQTVMIEQRADSIVIRPTQSFFSLRGSISSSPPYQKKEGRKKFIQSIVHS